MTAHILIFDSGLGGTTVFEEIHKRLPDCQFSYALDDDAFPYGNKSPQFLLNRIVPLMARLIDAAKPDLVIIACNTASTLTLQCLREQFDLPFVGVVPAIKPAAAGSESLHIGLLATDATISGDYVDELELLFAGECTLLRLPGQALVEIAEDKMLGKNFDTVRLKRIIKELASLPSVNHIDTLILGCTHFPALKKEIKSLWPTPIEIIDSGAAIANRVESLLHQLVETQESVVSKVYTTGDYNVDILVGLMKKYRIDAHEKIAISMKV